MSENIQDAFMWWGIIVSAFWFIWLNMRALSISEIEEIQENHYKRMNNLEDRIETLENCIEKTEKKRKTK